MMMVKTKTKEEQVEYSVLRYIYSYVLHIIKSVADSKNKY